MSDINKIITTLWLRRAHLGSYLRGFLLFIWTQLWLRAFFNSQQVRIGKKTKVQNTRCFLVTTPQARIIVGNHSLIYENARLEALDQGLIAIGDHSIIGDCRLSCRHSIQIGNHFLTSWNVFIQDHNPHPLEASLRNQQIETMLGVKSQSSISTTDWQTQPEPVTIGNSVWLGANVTILKGVTLGHGCVVAANSVVTRGQYPDNSLLAGVPARIIKQLGETHA